jgi:hypothetical protein
LRAYSTAVAASALGVDRRWLDNIIALNRIDGVRKERQGVSRAISPTAVLTIAIALELIDHLEVPIARALELARRLVLQNGDHSPSDGLNVRVDVDRIERSVAARLAEAVDAHPPPRRGRPPIARN